jgi:hypothetical protein
MVNTGDERFLIGSVSNSPSGGIVNFCVKF